MHTPKTDEDAANHRLSSIRYLFRVVFPTAQHRRGARPPNAKDGGYFERRIAGALDAAERRTVLIDGVSCAGKTTVCGELQRRGYHVIHGDEELAYWGDPKTGEPVNGKADAHRSWIWDVAKVNALVSDQHHAATFFCGGSRNADRFIDLFD